MEGEGAWVLWPGNIASVSAHPLAMRVAIGLASGGLGVGLHGSLVKIWRHHAGKLTLPSGWAGLGITDGIGEDRSESSTLWGRRRGAQVPSGCSTLESSS